MPLPDAACRDREAGRGRAARAISEAFPVQDALRMRKIE
jgi:hypothetical protein